MGMGISQSARVKNSNTTAQCERLQRRSGVKRNLGKTYPSTTVKNLPIRRKGQFLALECADTGPERPMRAMFRDIFRPGKKVGCGRKNANLPVIATRFVEIWNLVFTQYDRKKEASWNRYHIKMLIQVWDWKVAMRHAKPTDIDIFSPIIKYIEEITQVKYNGQMANAVLMRRIADHVKACVFCISDGVLPGNEGRYVEQWLLRRAIRDGTQSSA